ncbi:MAG: NADH-ubiquinone oxidoreductase-F iron-sulfur binding region domain-containing protein [Bacteroidales bacterium]
MDHKQVISTYLKHMADHTKSDDPGIDLSQIRKERVSRPYITVSECSCSIVNGSKLTIKAIRNYLDERAIKAGIDVTGSFGNCSYEPVVSVQLPGRSRIFFQNITAERVVSLLDNIFNHIVPQDDTIGQVQNSLHTPWPDIPFIHELSFFEKQNRRLLKDCGFLCPTNIEQAIATGRYTTFIKTINRITPDEVREVITESHLRGRSGSGFPTGIKWEKVSQANGEQKYLICNGMESDPGAFMERFLTESDPHLVLEGIALAAYAVGAEKAYLYISWENTLAIERMEQAISQAKSYGLLGDNIFNSGFSLQLSLFVSPGSFVCGQETAMINSIEGKRGIPSERPPYPSTKGLFGKPTLINNIETLANVPGIIQHGAEWFKQIGCSSSPGTKVFSVGGHVRKTCVVEVKTGTTFKHIIENLAGGPLDQKELKAFGLGGPTGHILPPAKAELPIDFDTLQQENLHLGSGGIIVMDHDTCMLDMARYVMGFLKEESCGKCISCREGTKNMLNILNNITQRPTDKSDNQTLERFKGVMSIESLAEVIRDTALCGLGENAPNVVLDTLQYFRREYEEHIFERKCTANVCSDMRTFYISVENCVGCAACLDKCPTDAIYGIPKHPHIIIENKCIGCGLCEKACMFNAIFIK